ncbi:hypothetical protein RCK87_26305, partial [Salmonella enterica subsp. enterica serovar 1,4,[5],12:i:-]
ELNNYLKNKFKITHAIQTIIHVFGAHPKPKFVSIVFNAKFCLSTQDKPHHCRVSCVSHDISKAKNAHHLSNVHFQSIITA